MDKQTFIEWARKLEPSYHASASVASRLATIDLIALVGPTGVGKTALIKELNIPYVPSDVSRAARAGEKNHHEYNFRNDYLDILKQIKNGEYVQFLVERNNEFYGTHISSYPKQGPAIMAVIAEAIPRFRTLGFRKVVPIYVLPPGYVEWMRRIGSDRSDDLEARLLEARKSLPTALADSDYRFVLNDDLATAAQEIMTVINGGVVSEHRAALARSSADQLFGRLGVDDDLSL